MNYRKLSPVLRLYPLIAVAALTVQAQSVTITGAVSITRATAGKEKLDNANAVVWLKPVSGSARQPGAAGNATGRPHFKILQHHKRFIPHVLAVPAGSVVDFPNLDPFFHNVFSMFDGKRFDLGLYEAGTSHAVTFDRVGICFIFCNIHPEMSAVVVVLDSPYYAVSNPAGAFSIPNVPPGRYFVSVWHERGKLEDANALPREVTISLEHASLPPIHLVDSGQLLAPHKNKYGRDYDVSKAAGTIYK